MRPPPLPCCARPPPPPLPSPPPRLSPPPLPSRAAPRPAHPRAREEARLSEGPLLADQALPALGRLLRPFSPFLRNADLDPLTPPPAKERPPHSHSGLLYPRSPFPAARLQRQPVCSLMSFSSQLTRPYQNIKTHKKGRDDSSSSR